MPRHTRYQALIVRDDAVLLIRHRLHETGQAYWVIPGGGREDGESEIDCVAREALEETHLEVEVERFLFEEEKEPEHGYRWAKTYLCRVIRGEAAPGYEPEADAAELYSISEVRWFDLRDEGKWPPALVDDPFTYPQLTKVRRTLGYISGEQAREALE